MLLTNSRMPASAGGGVENTDPNRQPVAAALLDAAADSAAAQSDDSRYLHVRSPKTSWSRSFQLGDSRLLLVTAIARNASRSAWLLRHTS